MTSPNRSTSKMQHHGGFPRWILTHQGLPTLTEPKVCCAFTTFCQFLFLFHFLRNTERTHLWRTSKQKQESKADAHGLKAKGSLYTMMIFNERKQTKSWPWHLAKQASWPRVLFKKRSLALSPGAGSYIGSWHFRQHLEVLLLMIWICFLFTEKV